MMFKHKGKNKNVDNVSDVTCIILFSSFVHVGINSFFFLDQKCLVLNLSIFWSLAPQNLDGNYQVDVLDNLIWGCV